MIPRSATTIDRSGTTSATPSTAIQMMASRDRRGFWIQNLGTADLWVYEFGPATAGQPSLKISAGTLYETPPGCAPSGPISVLSTGASQPYSAREW